MSIGSSPTSSKNIVPPFAASKNPILPLGLAPVKAPPTYPNSSLSKSVTGIELQFTSINGAFSFHIL